MTRLKFERTHRHFSQHDVATLAHIPQPQISQIERGILTPSHKQLARLAATFRFAPDELLKDVAFIGERR
jgi:transcriptional regulator with XRE-family HTH domain